MKKILILAALAASFGVSAQVAIGQSYKIPSDPTGTYFNLEINGSGRMRTIVTKREGKLGTSFSKREINCADRTFRYLGTADSLQELKTARVDEKMSPLTEGSVSTYVSEQACAAAPNGK